MTARAFAPDPGLRHRDRGEVLCLVERIRGLAENIGRTARIMEICGTHTMAAARAGLHSLLQTAVRLASGPGCPVCVTPPGYVALACDLARRPGITIATFGDMLRVPGAARRAGGGRGSLEAERAAGGDIRVLASAREALALARGLPGREVVFLAVGFETTAPTIAAALLEAHLEGIQNLTFLAAHKTMPRAIRAILATSGGHSLDGLLCPGHVSAITGTGIYAFVPVEFGVPCAVTGFEPAEILRGVVSILEQRIRREPAVENVYRRAVREEGNPRALSLMDEVFVPSDAEWRGIGVIPGSGLSIRPAYGDFDAERRFCLEVPDLPPPRECRCGEILRGLAEPAECPLFGRACTPGGAVGPCMVSSEGACAAAFRYGRAA